MIDQTKLDEWAALAEKATPPTKYNVTTASPFQRSDLFAFIEGARTAIPALLAEVRELRRENEALRNSATIVCPWCGDHDFDLIGLKWHIGAEGCESFRNTLWPAQERARIRALAVPSDLPVAKEPPRE